MRFLNKIIAEKTTKQEFSDKLAEVFKEDYQHVKQEKDGSGEVELGRFKVRWTPSSNDPAVWLTISEVKHVKVILDAERIKEAIEKLKDQMYDILGEIEI